MYLPGQNRARWCRPWAHRPISSPRSVPRASLGLVAAGTLPCPVEGQWRPEVLVGAWAAALVGELALESAAWGGPELIRAH